MRKPRDGKAAAGPDPVADMAGAALILLIAFIPVWLLIAVGPEGVSVESSFLFDLLPESIGDFLNRVLFSLVLGIMSAVMVFVAVWAGARGFRKACVWGRLSAAVLITAVLSWTAYEWLTEARLPVRPVLHLSFDETFSGGGLEATVNGREVVQGPGKEGQGVFVGGNGDWLDVKVPAGASITRSFTLEFWMRREDWINPYSQGSGAQTVVSLEFDKAIGWFRNRRPQVGHASFSLGLSVPRHLAETELLFGDHLSPQNLSRPSCSCNPNANQHAPHCRGLRTSTSSSRTYTTWSSPIWSERSSGRYYCGCGNTDCPVHMLSPRACHEMDRLRNDKMANKQMNLGCLVAGFGGVGPRQVSNIM